MQINTRGSIDIRNVERPTGRPVDRIYFANTENFGGKLLTLVRDTSQWVILQDSYGRPSGSGADPN